MALQLFNKNILCLIALLMIIVNKMNIKGSSSVKINYYSFLSHPLRKKRKDSAKGDTLWLISCGIITKILKYPFPIIYNYIHILYTYLIENNTSIFRQFIEPYFKVLEFGGFKAEFLGILFIFQNETVTKI